MSAFRASSAFLMVSVIFSEFVSAQPAIPIADVSAHGEMGGYGDEPPVQ